MKRALTAGLFAGLVMFLVPQAASAGSWTTDHAAGHECAAGEHGSDCATKSETEAPTPQGDAPGEGRSHYDRLHHDGDTF